MADLELKPCPFCGGPAKLEDRGNHRGEFFILGCANNDCRGHYFAYTETMEDRAKAIEDWNTRSPNSDPVKAFADWCSVGPKLAKAAGLYVGIKVSAAPTA